MTKAYDQGDNELFGNSIVQIPDGGYFVLNQGFYQSQGYTSNLMKLNDAGDVVSHNPIDGVLGSYPRSICKLSDGDYAVVGQVGNSWWIAEYDETGNKISYRVLDILNSPWTVRPTSDGGCIVAGWTGSGSIYTNDVVVFDYVVKFDKDLNIEWQTSATKQPNSDYALSVRQTSDGGYIACGDTQSNGWVAKLDKSGNALWQNYYGYNGVINDVKQTSDGGYIFTGYLSPYKEEAQFSQWHGNDDVWVGKLDANGNVIWQKLLGGSVSDHGINIEQTSDGNYFVAGTTSSKDCDVIGNHGDPGTADGWFIELDQDGNLLWQETLGSDGSDERYNAHQTSDGGYVASGATDTLSGQEVWVVKLARDSLIQPPVASFTTNVVSGEVPLTVSFKDTSTGINIKSWLWDFGNGDKSNSQNAVETYNKPGTYTASLKVTNDAGISSTYSVTITVKDTTPPTITASSKPMTFWPPNHKYQTVSIKDFVSSVKDIGDPSVDISKVVITSVGSDEPEFAPGKDDENTLKDIVIKDSHTVDLRAERQGDGNGRVYTINYQVSDASSNTAYGSYQVWVPHDQGKGSTAVDDGAAKGYTVNSPY